MFTETVGGRGTFKEVEKNVSAEARSGDQSIWEVPALKIHRRCSTSVARVNVWCARSSSARELAWLLVLADV